MKDSFVIDENQRCFLNGVAIDNVLKVDIKNINPIEKAEVVLTVSVDEIDIKHKGLFK